MPTFKTYIELPILVEFDWDENEPSITSIQLRSDQGRTFLPKIDESKLPQVNLEEWLNDKEIKSIEREIIEDAENDDPRI